MTPRADAPEPGRAQADAWRAAGLQASMPAMFVLIWSTGFVVARFGMPHAGPLSFLTVRYALSVLAFGVWIGWLARTPPAWPRDGAQWRHLAVTGTLLHAGYLGGVWAAVKDGLGAGLVALIVGLQPLLTALWVSASGAERSLAPRQWAGLVLGLVGLLLVVGHKVGQGEVNAWNLALALFALASITVGTLYHKRFVAPCDVRTANAVQLLAAFAVTAPLAWLLERDAAVALHPHLVGAMAWSVLVLTLGGSSLMYLLLQRGAATRVTSLMYLVPPCTALMAWALFDERMGVWALVGLVLSAVGVALVVREPSAAGSARASPNPQPRDGRP